jgi:hypothetical protein
MMKIHYPREKGVPAILEKLQTTKKTTSALTKRETALIKTKLYKLLLVVASEITL